MSRSDAQLLLTAALVVITAIYATLTWLLARQAKRANDLSAKNSRVTRLMNAPLLTLEQGPNAIDFHSEGAPASYQVDVVVSNSAHGIATEIEMVTDWPDLFRFEEAVSSVGGRRFLLLTIPHVRPEGFTGNPVISEWRFTDLSGTRYRQPVGGRPVPIDHGGRERDETAPD